MSKWWLNGVHMLKWYFAVHQAKIWEGEKIADH